MFEQQKPKCKKCMLFFEYDEGLCYRCYRQKHVDEEVKKSIDWM